MPNDYKPPFEISDSIITAVAEIAELCGRISVISKSDKKLTLRRKNRIKTVYS